MHLLQPGLNIHILIKSDRYIGRNLSRQIDGLIGRFGMK